MATTKQFEPPKIQATLWYSSTKEQHFVCSSNRKEVHAPGTLAETQTGSIKDDERRSSDKDRVAVENRNRDIHKPRALIEIYIGALEQRSKAFGTS